MIPVLRRPLHRLAVLALSLGLLLPGGLLTAGAAAARRPAATHGRVAVKKAERKRKRAHCPRKVIHRKGRRRAICVASHRRKGRTSRRRKAPSQKRRARPTLAAASPHPAATLSGSAAPAASGALSAPAQPSAPAVGLGNVPGCLSGGDPTAWLHAYRATVLHVIVDPTYGADGSALPCLQAASAAGYEVNLAIQWWNSWRPQQVAGYVRSVLAIYAPYLWAVSLGNEQELYAGGRGLSGWSYARDWAAAEPLVAAMAPTAIRVAGEISPWGLDFMEQALQAGLPGAQAVAGHPYDWSGCFDVSDFEQLAGAYGLPAWFTEGLAGPDSFGPDRSLSELSGGALDVIWLKKS